MICSMTAFARAHADSHDGGLICEIRSINHRYLEMNIYLPDTLRALEMPIRDCIREHIKRGKIECSIRYERNTAHAPSCKINDALAKEYCAASEKIAGFLKTPAPITPTDILRMPGVIETQEADVNALQKNILQLMTTTLKDLIKARGREGEELKQLFLQRMDLMQIEHGKVQQRLPYILTEQQDRIRKRFAELKLEIDAARLEQEMLIFMQRIDVAEELDRLQTHIAEIRRILKEGGMVGRRLDFLLQELNREANTLGAKSIDSVTSHAAVEMKVLIEQVREQVQNIE